MNINLEMLEEVGACEPGVRLYRQNFDDETGGDIQELIDVCVREHEDAFAFFLIDKFGGDGKRELQNVEQRSLVVAGNAVIRGDVKLRHNLFASGDVIVEGNLHAGRDIRARSVRAKNIYARLNIETAQDVVAEEDIRIGLSMTAGGEIKHGEGFGVYAGLQCPDSNKGHGDVIRAAKRPDNIVKGTWYEDEEV